MVRDRQKRRHSTWQKKGVPIPVERRERLIELICAGWSLNGASAEVGVSQPSSVRLWRRFGHMEMIPRFGSGGLPRSVARDSRSPEPPQRRMLTSEDRATIQAGMRLKLSYAVIGELIGRNKGVVCREVERNSSPDGKYRGCVAHRVAGHRRQRPKQFKLIANPALCRRIEGWMDQGWSPRLIAVMLAVEHGADQTARVSHETIYQALYVQTRGSLRADLHRQLSLKRSHRTHRGHSRHTQSPFKEAFKISERPPEVADRAVPGHWEGDLIQGPGNQSAIGTLVERTTRFTILLHLPGRHDSTTVADAMIREMRHLPEYLRRSITWDRGTEMADYARIQLALDAKLYFCDPRSPWQRGSNENTNRLLRFWFEKHTDLSGHTAADLRRVADTLNKRPRPTLGLETPADRLNKLLLAA
jgi:transposase, IS30 family